MSVTVTLLADPGPRFLTVAVYVRFVPTWAGSADSVIAIVGDYAKVKDQLTEYKNITFLDTDGKVIPAPQ